MNGGIVKAGDRIFYTGDMANDSDWATVVKVWSDGFGEHVDLQYDSGRTTRVSPSQVGERYEGHCNPRFVTERAVEEYRDRMASVGVVL